MSAFGNGTLRPHQLGVVRLARTRLAASERTALLLSLLGLVFASTLVRALLLSDVRGPWTFMDELEYEKLAQSVGRTGHAALFTHAGFTLPPLYSLVLAPIYALLSPVRAYDVVKVVNAILMSLSLVPTYGIARTILPRRWALGASAVMAFAPLMFYSALVMSENIAYPLFLVAAWALIRAVRQPSASADLTFVVSLIGACLARLQFVVLLPAALTAIGIAGVIGAAPLDERVALRLKRSFASHPVMLGITALVALGTAGLAGAARIDSSLGVYGKVLHSHAPTAARVLELLVEHVAEVDLALCVLPFVGTVVAAVTFVRRRSGPAVTAYAAVASSLTLWLLLEVVYGSGSFLTSSGPARLHERYLLYLFLFFVVASIAAIRLPAAAVSLRTQIAAVAFSALLPALIPYRTVINGTIAADTWGLLLYAQSASRNEIDHAIVAVPQAGAIAVTVASILGLTYRLTQCRPRAFTVLLVVLFVFMTALVRARVVANSTANAATLSHQGWVDSETHGGAVVLVTNVRRGAESGPAASRRVAFLQTAFYNMSVARIYYACAPVFGAEFGEEKASLGASGIFHDSQGPLRARYAVVPSSFHLRGRVVARQPHSRLALIEPVGGVLSVSTGARLC